MKSIIYVLALTAVFGVSIDADAQNIPKDTYALW